MLARLKAPQWAGLGLIGGLVIFPYMIAMLTGQPIDSGVPKFWQGCSSRSSS